MRPLLAVALLAACATTSPPPPRRARRPRAPRAPAAAAPARPPSTFTTPAPPLAPTLPRPAPRPPPAADEPRCREVTRHNEELLAARVGAASPACAGAAVAALRESFARCAFGPEGAWAAELTDARAEEEGGVCRAEVRWRAMLLRAGAGVAEAGDVGGRVGRTFRVVAAGDEVQSYTRLELTSSDLDGDGVPELAVVAEAVDHGLNRRERDVEVYTAGGHRVAVFEPTRAMRVIDVTDVDSDGRADLVVPAPYTWSEGAECGRTVIREPLSLVAHALSRGGFSTTDDVAARHLRAVCPGPDADASPPATGAGVDPAGLGVICRRLWGATPEEALAPLRCERFRAEPSALCAQTTHALPPLEPGECPAHYDVWAHAPPPLRLR